MITKDSANIEVKGHIGTWYVIDEKKISGRKLFLVESEQYGDEAAHLIITEKGNLVMNEVYNGFDDYIEAHQ